MFLGTAWHKTHLPNFGLPEAGGDGLDGTLNFAEELSHGFELGRQFGHDATCKTVKVWPKNIVRNSGAKITIRGDH